MIEKIQVGLIMNETQAMVMFPTASKREIDTDASFYSKDRIFHEWCLDYFNYMWQSSKPFNPAKLNEI